MMDIFLLLFQERKREIDKKEKNLQTQWNRAEVYLYPRYVLSR